MKRVTGGLWCFVVGLSGCWEPPCGSGVDSTCEVVDPTLGEYPVVTESSDCTGDDRSECLGQAVVYVEEEEVIFRWTDGDGVRWEATWPRTE